MLENTMQPNRMGRVPEWHARADFAADTLEMSLDPEYIDSRILAQLLQVSLREAQRIIQRVPLAQRNGRTYLLHRKDAALWLRAAAHGMTAQQELARRNTLAAKIRGFDREILTAGRYAKVEIGTPEERHHTAARLSDLPDTMELRPGELRVQFTTAVDLMSQLWKLSQVAIHSLEKFRDFEVDEDRQSERRAETIYGRESITAEEVRA